MYFSQFQYFLFLSVLCSFLLLGCEISGEDKDAHNSFVSGSGKSLLKEEVYCLDKGGSVGKVQECGREVAVCILKDGTDCPLIQFFKGHCEEGVIVEWGEECR